MDALWRIGADELFVGGRRPVDFDRYIILVFDNSYSKLRSKTYVYQVLTGESAIVALEQAQNTANHESSKEPAATADTTANKPDFRASSIATVRYVNDGVGGIVSSIVIRVQAASTAIHSKAKTTVENIQVYTTHMTAIFCYINCLYFICWLSLVM